MAEQHVPDIYADRFAVFLSGLGDVLIPFARAAVPQRKGAELIQGENIQVGVLRMTKENAKVFAMSLRKQLKEFEKQQGEIKLIVELTTAFGVVEADW